jgi:hypothetical protein
MCILHNIMNVINTTPTGAIFLFLFTSQLQNTTLNIIPDNSPVKDTFLIQFTTFLFLFYILYGLCRMFIEICKYYGKKVFNWVADGTVLVFIFLLMYL